MLRKQGNISRLGNSTVCLGTTEEESAISPKQSGSEASRVGEYDPRSLDARVKSGLTGKKSIFQGVRRIEIQGS